MSCYLELDIIFDDKHLAKAIFDSIIPDVEKKLEKRSESNFFLEGNKICLKISARDNTALKASFNSYLKQIALCVNIEEGLYGRKC
ncbi:MAG: KEOPS complex subunit Pcc1 [Candidatus Diapherotrites archaeon]|nr:KEOPS complex subunit Pcc1 [Candidatus Diapherotrites archaeon]